MSELTDRMKEKDEYNELLTEYVQALRKRSNPSKLKELSDFRNMPLETLEKAGIFYVGEMGELLLPNYLKHIKNFGIISPTNNKPIFSNRWIIPILNQGGKVENFVGYSPDADERYIYGTAKYYLRRDTMYGLENLHIAYELGYAILTEGITDTLRLRSLGLLNSYANCGTHGSEVIKAQLNRCEHGLIRLPDRDSAGVATKKKWITNRYVTLCVAAKYKDPDEMLREPENVEWFMSYFQACVDYIKSAKHRGQTFAPLEATIM